MEVTSLIGRPVKILTVDEYKEALKEYYTSSGNEDTVVWFFSGNGYKFLTKFRTFEEVGQIYWKHEPLMKHWFSSLENCLANLNRSGGMCGTSMRWLPGNGASHEEVVLQPTIIPSENTEGYIDKMTDTALQDRMFGLLMDPFVYVAEFGDGKYIDEEDPRYGVLDNYRVFSMEITREEYEKMEQEYVESIRTFKYDDGLLRKDNWKSFGMTEEFIKFMKKHSHYKFEDDDIEEEVDLENIDLDNVDFDKIDWPVVSRKFLIKKAIKRANGNRKETAALIGISERTLYRWMKELNINIKTVLAASSE